VIADLTDWGLPIEIAECGFAATIDNPQSQLKIRDQ